MSKYILKASCGWVGCDAEEDITDWFSENDYKRYENGENLTELDIAAQELVNFEWYIEKIDE